MRYFREETAQNITKPTLSIIIIIILNHLWYIPATSKSLLQISLNKHTTIVGLWVVEN